MKLGVDFDFYTLTKTLPAEVEGAPKMAWSIGLTVTTSDQVNYPAEIFVFQVEDFEDNARAWFSTVATPSDLQEYPVDAPAEPVEGVQQPYFRKSEVLLISRSAEDLELLIELIEKRIHFLERNLTSYISLSS